MSSLIASYPRARRSDLPHYVRKFRLESSELTAIDQKRLAPPRSTSPSAILIWMKVAVMSAASTGLLYIAVLMMQ